MICRFGFVYDLMEPVRPTVDRMGAGVHPITHVYRRRMMGDTRRFLPP